MVRSAAHQFGTTLIELITSIVIVAIAIFGLMLAISAVVARSADPMIEQQALAIAESYLEEVMLADFCDPAFLAPGQTCRQHCVASACGVCAGPPGFGEASRNLFDDVCDYDGISDTSGARDRDGALIGGLGAYDVAVSVVDSGVTLGTPSISSDAGEVVRIDVRVAHSALETDIVVSAFRANTQ